MNKEPYRPRTFADYVDAGYLSALIPILPPNAPLGIGSESLADRCGKVPGFYHTSHKTWAGFAQWVQYETTLEDVKRWSEWPGVGVGIRTGGKLNLLAIDVDCTASDTCRKFHAAAIDLLGPSPLRMGNAPKFLLLYQAPAGVSFSKLRHMFTIPDSEPGQAIEVLGEGRQFVAEGIHPKTGKPYEWHHGHPCDKGYQPSPVAAQAAA